MPKVDPVEQLRPPSVVLGRAACEKMGCDAASHKQRELQMKR